MTVHQPGWGIGLGDHVWDITTPVLGGVASGRIERLHRAGV
jgi:hypothetical protein